MKNRTFQKKKKSLVNRSQWRTDVVTN